MNGIQEAKSSILFSSTRISAHEKSWAFFLLIGPHSMTGFHIEEGESSGEDSPFCLSFYHRYSRMTCSMRSRPVFTVSKEGP